MSLDFSISVVLAVMQQFTHTQALFPFCATSQPITQTPPSRKQNNTHTHADIYPLFFDLNSQIKGLYILSLLYAHTLHHPLLYLAFICPQGLTQLGHFLQNVPNRRENKQKKGMKDIKIG